MHNKMRTKTILTTDQRLILSKSFKKNMFPSSTERLELSKQLDLKPRTVQIWFQNQRQKQKSYYNSLDYEVPPKHSLNLLADVVLDVENIRL